MPAWLAAAGGTGRAAALFCVLLQSVRARSCGRRSTLCAAWPTLPASWLNHTHLFPVPCRSKIFSSLLAGVFAGVVGITG